MAKLLATMSSQARVSECRRKRDGSRLTAWPLENVWIGASIENDNYVCRADYVRRTPAAVRFLSLEPLIGDVPSLDLRQIDWVIVGGESGRRARPMRLG